MSIKLSEGHDYTDTGMTSDDKRVVREILQTTLDKLSEPTIPDAVVNSVIVNLTAWYFVDEDETVLERFISQVRNSIRNNRKLG